MPHVPNPQPRQEDDLRQVFLRAQTALGIAQPYQIAQGSWVESLTTAARPVIKEAAIESGEYLCRS
jgi:hypothetical protein